MDSSVAVALTGLVTFQGVQLFAQHAPKMTEVREADLATLKGMAVAADLRVAEVEAASVTILAGLAITAMTKSSIPAWLAILSIGISIGVYEWALRL
jgi:hypothetical protein